jgi:predicted restriction endonuclease
LLEQAGGFPGTSYAVLNRIHERLTGSPFSKKIGPDPEQSDLDEQNEIEESESQQDVSKLLNDLRNLKPTDPEQVEVHGKVYKRDNKTIAQLKIMRGHKCQICGQGIKKKDGSFYIEAAHITPKKQKGTELPSNIILLCPNHHKEFDLGKKEILKRNDEIVVVLLNEKEHSIDLRL